MHVKGKKKINAIKCVLMPNINDGIYGKTNYNHIKKKKFKSTLVKAL